MSATPITDVLVWPRLYEGCEEYRDMVDHARQLERQLLAMTEYAGLASDVIKRAKMPGERP